MKEKAIAKIRAEMDADKSNGNLQDVGELLLQYLQDHPDVAVALLAEGVTLKKACQAMHDEARRRAGGKNSFWMSDAEGMTLILEYFGIKASGVSIEKGNLDPAATVFDLNLDDLLEI